MASRFTQQATAQLAPAYQQQIAAVQSQIPAIQQLYQALIQGLQGQQQAGNQNILEDASARGVLRSSMPVYGQQQLGQQILQQQGQYAGQQQKELGGIYSQIAGINTERATGIANLANSLYGNDIQQQSLNNQIAQGNRSYALQQQTAQQQYQLGLQAAQKGY
jgi:hypothetical protein